MKCHCCDADTKLARKVKLRSDPARISDPPTAAEYRFYLREMTYRWAFICNACYRTLDNDLGYAEVCRGIFSLAGLSRGDKAPLVNETKYQAFQRHEAEKLGLQV